MILPAYDPLNESALVRLDQECKDACRECQNTASKAIEGIDALKAKIDRSRKLNAKSPLRGINVTLFVPPQEKQA